MGCHHIDTLDRDKSPLASMPASMTPSLRRDANCATSSPLLLLLLLLGSSSLFLSPSRFVFFSPSPITQKISSFFTFPHPLLFPWPDLHRPIPSLTDEIFPGLPCSPPGSFPLLDLFFLFSSSLITQKNLIFFHLPSPSPLPYPFFSLHTPLPHPARPTPSPPLPLFPDRQRQIATGDIDDSGERVQQPSSIGYLAPEPLGPRFFFSHQFLSPSLWLLLVPLAPGSPCRVRRLGPP